jgi:hypothetical protein
MMLTLNKGCNCVRNYESTAAVEAGIESLVRTGLCKDNDAADQEVGCEKGKKGSSQSSSDHESCNFLCCRSQCCRKQGHKVKLLSTVSLPSLITTIYCCQVPFSSAIV